MRREAARILGINPSTPPSQRRADIERLEAQLAEWTACIAQYRASAKRADAKVRTELDRITDDLQRRRNEAGAQVMLLKGSSDAQWDDLRLELEHAWEDVRRAFRKGYAQVLHLARRERHTGPIQ